MGFVQRRLHFLMNKEFLCVWGRVVGGCGGPHSAGGKSFWRMHSFFPLSKLTASGSCFSRFPPSLLHHSYWSVFVYFSVSFSSCFCVGNVSSGTENITEVTETTLAPTPTLTQQEEMYVLHLTCIVFIKHNMFDELIVLVWRWEIWEPNIYQIA